MNNMSSHERRVNNLLVLAIFVVTALAMALAAGLGIFSASSEDTATAAKETIEASAQTSNEQSESLSDEATLERSFASSAEAPSAQVVSELKLQEVRDTYLQFGEAIDGVSVHYEQAKLCGTSLVCVDPQNADRILVNEMWAAESDLHTVKIKLAQAHADLVIDRVWHSTRRAQDFLNQILPACEVLDDIHLKQAAGLEVSPNITAANASVEGFKDIIVSQLVPDFNDLDVYPRALHSEVQVTAAQQLANGQTPDVVLPVAAVNCSGQ